MSIIGIIVRDRVKKPFHLYDFREQIFFSKNSADYDEGEGGMTGFFDSLALGSNKENGQ